MVENTPGKHKIERVRFDRQFFDIAANNVDVETLHAGIVPGKFDRRLRQINRSYPCTMPGNACRERPRTAADVEDVLAIELLPVHLVPEKWALADNLVFDFRQLGSRLGQPVLGFPVGIGHGFGFPPGPVPVLTDNGRILCLLPR